MSGTGTDLLARARGRTPADPAVRACWDAVVLAVLSGALAADDVHRLGDDLRAGRDTGAGQLEFAHVGDELRVTFQDRPATCPPAAMCAELARLVAEPPDATLLAASEIEWAHSGDAELAYRAKLDGRNLLIRVNDFPAEPLYTLVVDGTELAVLEGWPPAWRRPPVPANLLAGSAGGGRAGGAIGIGRLRVWSERLCRVAAGEPADLVAVLEIAGSATTNAFGSLVVEPPPPGTARIDLSWRDGRPDSMRIGFSGVALTRADFDDYFGHGMWMPRVHWDSAHQLAYHVEVPGAPATCAVFPSFTEEPVDTAVASGVTLRIDRH
jgi:hypothetical protein